jgi:hypothetical protein
MGGVCWRHGIAGIWPMRTRQGTSAPSMPGRGFADRCGSTRKQRKTRMKKTLTTTLALLAGAFAVHAQGTVSFVNYASLTYLYVSLAEPGQAARPLGGSTSGPTPTLSNYASLIGNGNDWSVELYGAAGAGVSANALLPLGSTATFANGVNDFTPGTWVSTAVINIPGTTFAGQYATVQLYAWYNEGGLITSFAQAVADGVPAGFSSVANMSVGGPNPSGPPSVPPELPYPALVGGSDFTGFIFSVAPGTVPEPSAIALGVMGASAFLMRLRRKK